MAGDELNPDLPAPSDGAADATQRAFRAALSQPTPAADLITGDEDKDAWLKDVLDGRISLGRPAPPPRTGKRGRPKKPTEWHEARHRRERIRKEAGKLILERHRRDKFPKARRGKTKAALDPMLAKFCEVVRQVLADERIPKHKQAKEIEDRCARLGAQCPTRPTVKGEIRRALWGK